MNSVWHSAMRPAAKPAANPAAADPVTRSAGNAAASPAAASPIAASPVAAIPATASPTDWWRMLRYLLAGGSAFALDFALLYLFRSGLGMYAWLGATLAFIISTVYAFLCQKYFTFASSAPTGRALIRYLLLLGCNTAFTALLVQVFDVFGWYLAGKVVASVATTLWNYPLMGRWVYQNRLPREASWEQETDCG